ncbi:nucleotidyltransferase domain-containing protein [Patescibacteria group bacterium]|nr:nucleotidyltransferase domain-containing protein [Patescibacteria group bacterium]
MRTKITKDDGIRIAKELKKLFVKRGYPIKELRIFGSVSRDDTNPQSDIDIAVLCSPFLKTKHDENTQFLLDSKEVDLRIQTICLHPEDLDNKYFGLAQEIKKNGIKI